MSTPGFGNIPSAQTQALKRVRQLVGSGEYSSAIAIIPPLLKAEPRNPDLLRLYGFSLMMSGFAKQGLGHLRFAAQLRPDDPEILCDLSMVNRWLGKTRDAYLAIDQALKLNPHHPRAISTKARLLQSHAKTDEAMDLLSDALANTKSPSIVVIHAQLCRELKRYQEGIDAIRPVVEDPSVPRSARCDLLFAYGHLLDALGEYDDAFRHFALGNAMGEEGMVTDFEAIKDTWTPETLAALSPAGNDGARAVLIVGMPRSGTTLTEQIIAAHPDADSVGESPCVFEIMRAQGEEPFDRDAIERASATYLKMLDSRVPDMGIDRICDKMPENFLHLGAISRFLPAARVIHCTRDARDTCLSIYFQHFAPMIRYARDQELIARQYLGYLDLMHYWGEHLEIDIHDSSYECLTSEPEAQISALLEHAGLPFDRACLAFHTSKKTVNTASATQVRQPLYRSSTNRWKHYEKHIGVMLDVLGDV
jgi:tetratricopeptide (TPR) repeat protein